MSSKNTVGNAYHYSMRKIDRVIKEIDKRTVNGKDRENVDPTWQKHTVNKEGARVWTF